MKYVKPEIEEIELIESKCFVSISDPEVEIPEEDGNDGGSWKEPLGPTE